jgi:hypothetical protein
MTMLPRTLLEQAARHRWLECVELVDALPKKPKAKVRNYRLRARGAESVRDREGDPLTP